MQRVAEAAGVSKSSVSLALRDDPRLAPSTRRRVQEAAARLGYRKNPIVSALMAQLRVSHTPTFQANFALINCSDNRAIFDWHTFAEFRRGARERAEQMGYGIEEFWAQEPGLKLSRLRQILLTRGIKGLLLAATLEPKPLFAGHPEFFHEFTCAAIGVERTDPPLPRAANNHYQTVRMAVDAALQRGYRRPGLVLWDKLDHLLARRMSAGFLTGVHDANGQLQARVPPLLLEPMDFAEFAKWMRAEQPDVIITDQVQVREWVLDLRLVVPDEVGLIHLDWAPHLTEWAGMRQNSHLIGAAAADLVIGQVTRNEVGPPDHPKLVLIESDWVAGPSVREAANGRRVSPLVARG